MYSGPSGPRTSLTTVTSPALVGALSARPAHNTNAAMTKIVVWRISVSPPISQAQKHNTRPRKGATCWTGLFEWGTRAPFLSAFVFEESRAEDLGRAADRRRLS